MTVPTTRVQCLGARKKRKLRAVVMMELWLDMLWVCKEAGQATSVILVGQRGIKMPHFRQWKSVRSTA